MEIETRSKTEIKAQKTIPCIIALIGTALMFLTIFLPYATATAEQAKMIKNRPDEIIYEELDMTAEDMRNISMVEYAMIYGELSEQILGDASYGIMYVAIVALIGIFSLLSVLFAILKKPIPVIIFGLLALGAFSIQNFDYTDRGVIPSRSYEWGAAYYIFYIAFAIALIGSVWLLTLKIKEKKQVQKTNCDIG